MQVGRVVAFMKGGVILLGSVSEAHDGWLLAKTSEDGEAVELHQGEVHKIEPTYATFSIRKFVAQHTGITEPELQKQSNVHDSADGTQVEAEAEEEELVGSESEEEEEEEEE